MDCGIQCEVSSVHDFLSDIPRLNVGERMNQVCFVNLSFREVSEMLMHSKI
jgi:hypothetical protein